jgi:hypothetical protein
MSILLITGTNCGKPSDGVNTVDVNTGSTSYTDTYKYACLDGFSTTNETLIICRSDGTWSSGPPQCCEFRYIELIFTFSR